MKLEGVLRGITALIVRSCDPDQILLFGSHAKGQDDADSDLDILVIGNFPECRFLRGQELRELLHRYPVRIDLHVVSPQEVAAESTTPTSFLSSVLASGIVLHSRGDASEER
jgi:predicted nucleotidyltransferase